MPLKPLESYFNMKSKFRINGANLLMIVGILAVIAVVYTELNKPAMEAEIITNIILDDHKASFANNGVVDEIKLEKIKNMDYDDFKKSLNAKNDFCVYIEDEKGNMILAKGTDKLDCR